MRVLLTGAAGFTGSHLAEFLLNDASVARDAARAGDAGSPLELHCVVHRHDRRIHHLRQQMQFHRGDLRNGLSVNDLIQTVQPDYVMHLAAWSDVVVGSSRGQPMN